MIYIYFNILDKCIVFSGYLPEMAQCESGERAFVAEGLTVGGQSIANAVMGCGLFGPAFGYRSEHCDVTAR